MMELKFVIETFGLSSLDTHPFHFTGIGDLQLDRRDIDSFDLGFRVLIAIMAIDTPEEVEAVESRFKDILSAHSDAFPKFPNHVGKWTSLKDPI
jgi:hypothetical protein